MNASEIRQKYLDFFVEKGHQVEPSASLVPVDDPSLLWINSGVATLKKYFDGREKPRNPRLVNAQKAIRTNDIENVGYTARHHTFFEMLGNFSIGEYFKKEAIHWAWEFLTSPRWMGLEPERLSVTVYPEDDEAYRYWHEEIGIPQERIIKLEENFWDIGEGPCGPNTEIFYDRGEALCDPSDPECYPGGENERYLEIWNLVFSQYNHNPDESYTPLPKKNIDTGMGLERMASVMQEVSTNYDTDLFQPIIQVISREVGLPYGKDAATDTAFKVMADHVRTLVFSIADGVLPSNEGRGYVLRRLLRRAVRFAKKIGMNRPFLYQLTGTVAEIMQHHYPEPVQKQAFIEKVIYGEEERFLETLSDGLQMLEELVHTMQAEGRSEIAGEEAFTLYDTYGFPVDLTEDFARERDLTVDHKGFAQEMEKQRQRARTARQAVDSMQVQDQVLSSLDGKSEFIGYELMQAETRVHMLVKDGQPVSELQAGEKGLILLDQTPFYAESGGQIADQGWIESDQTQIQVEDVQKGPQEEHWHQIFVEKGKIRQNDPVSAKIDSARRREVVKNHTATHLLHQALKRVLGDHVSQAGSLVAPDRLRFDFTHIQGLSEDEIEQVEQQVNQQIWENLSVDTMILSLTEAKKMGAEALFGEKYGEEVRVVQMGDFSLELCGGTHVHRTSEVGVFKILSEAGIGSGIRRIEAVTGRKAVAYFEAQVRKLQAIAARLKTNPQDVVKRVDQLQQEWREVKQENETIKAKLNQSAAKQLIDQIEQVQDIPVLVAQVEAQDMDQLRRMVDDLKSQLTEGVIVLGAVSQEKVHLIASISPKYVQAGLHAGKLIKEIASLCGGGGGGRPDLAQAGGKRPDQLPTALKQVKSLLKKKERKA